MWKIEANNWGKEKRDYIKEALEYTGQEAQKLQRSLFVEKVAPNKWNYKLDTTKKYLEGIRNDYSYLNLSKNKTTTVMATQIALFKAWYMWVGHIDARWWSYTMGCIKKFQRENDLPVSWYLTKRTVDKLLAVASEKQWLAPETRNQKKKEVKKPEEKPKTPTPKKKNPTVSRIDRNQRESEPLTSIDSSKIRKEIAKIWDFDNIEHNFIIKHNEETIWGKKHLQIMGSDYEEYPTGESNIDNSTSKNWYHNGLSYFIFGKYINWECYEGIKVSYDWTQMIIEKGEFNTLMEDTLKKWERIYENWKVEKWTFESEAAWDLKSWTIKENWKTTNLTEV